MVIKIEASGRLPVRTGAGGELARQIDLGGDVGGECPGAVQGRGLDVGRGREGAGPVGPGQIIDALNLAGLQVDHIPGESGGMALGGWNE